VRLQALSADPMLRLETSVTMAVNSSTVATRASFDFSHSGSPIQWPTFPQALQVEVSFLRAIAFMPSPLPFLPLLPEPFGLLVDELDVDDAPAGLRL